MLAWLLCLPRLATLGSVLQFLGAFVASTIWPIAMGLYSERVNRAGAVMSMVLGTGCGLIAYWAIGFYVAALVSALVSVSVVVLSTWLAPSRFDWSSLGGPATRQEAL
jgi:Na+/pantothenate symporter